MSQEIEPSATLIAELQTATIAAGDETSLNVRITFRAEYETDVRPAVMPGRVIQIGPESEKWNMISREVDEQVETLPDALHRVVALHQAGASAIALVMTEGTEIRDTKALIAAIELLNRIEVPLYVISCNSDVDHRLLSQFSTLSGGEYALLRSPEMWDAHARNLLNRVRAGLERVGFISIESPAMMDLEAFFSIHPQMGLVQLSSPQQPRSSISFPLLRNRGDDTAQQFFVSVGVPRLQEGNYLLAQIKCRRQLDDPESCFAQTKVCFSVASPNYKPSLLKPELARIEHQLHLSTLLEVMAQSYLREDGSHISRILEMLEHDLLLLGLSATADRLSEIRMSFLHRGSFALPQLNETWRLIYEATQALHLENIALSGD